MDAMEYFKERKRLCNSYDDCEDCPLGKKNNGKDCYCNSIEERFPDKTIKIVEKWSNENPIN